VAGDQLDALKCLHIHEVDVLAPDSKRNMPLGMALLMKESKCLDFLLELHNKKIKESTVKDKTSCLPADSQADAKMAMVLAGYIKDLGNTTTYQAPIAGSLAPTGLTISAEAKYLS
jgi:hypothetical protein